MILKTKSSKTAEDIHPLETNSKKNILDFKKDAKNIGMLLKGSTFMDVCFSEHVSDFKLNSYSIQTGTVNTAPDKAFFSVKKN